MAGRRKKKSDDEGGGAPAWMVTYGDLMSLLLTFFVLLLSFSTISEKDFNDAIMSLQGALGVLTGSPGIAEDWPERRQPRTPAAVEKRAQELQRRMQVANVQDEVNIEIDEEGGFIEIVLPGEFLFESGRAILRPEAFGVLQDIAEAFADLPGALIECRGHTDNVPTGSDSAFGDNWELSFHRAKAVMQYLQRQPQMEDVTFESIACGPDQPIAPNTTPQGRAENRRVTLRVRGDLDKQAEQDIERVLGPGEPTGPEVQDFGEDFWKNL